MGCLYEMADGRPDEMWKLSQMYLQSMDDYLRKLRKAAAHSNCRQVEALAHAAAGASSFLGMEGMSSLLRKLEHQGKMQNAQGIQQILPALEEMFQRVSRFLLSQKMPADR